MLFRAGDAPIWNRNECILPMSWRLFSNTITQPGKEYTLQTIPTLSSAIDFDLKSNQPDFEKMLDKRMEQAVYAQTAMQLFQDSYGYTDADIARLDIDAYSKEIMEMVNDMMWADIQRKARAEAVESDNIDDITGEINIDPNSISYGNVGNTEANTAVTEEIEARSAADEERKKKIYVGGFISKEDIVRRTQVGHAPKPQRGFDKDFIEVFKELRGTMLADVKHFKGIDGNLCSADGGKIYIKSVDAKTRRERAEELATINAAAQNEESRVFAEEEITLEDLPEIEQWEVMDDFYYFLESLPDWSFANGRFEQEIIKRVK